MLNKLRNYLKRNQQIVCTHFNREEILSGEGYYYLSPADFYEKSSTNYTSRKVGVEEILSIREEKGNIVFPGEIIYFEEVEEMKKEFTTKEIYSGKNIALLDEGTFVADYIEYSFESGGGIAYGEEGHIEFFLTDEEIDRIAQHSSAVGAGDIFNAAWEHYDSRAWKKAD